MPYKMRMRRGLRMEGSLCDLFLFVRGKRLCKAINRIRTTIIYTAVNRKDLLLHLGEI